MWLQLMIIYIKSVNRKFSLEIYKNSKMKKLFVLHLWINDYFLISQMSHLIVIILYEPCGSDHVVTVVVYE